MQALKWAILATYDDGEYEPELFDRAKRLRKEMSERLPPDQVDEGECAARSWQANRLKK